MLNLSLVTWIGLWKGLTDPFLAERKVTPRSFHHDRDFEPDPKGRPLSEGPTGDEMKSKLYPIGVALVLLATIMAAGILMVPK